MCPYCETRVGLGGAVTLRNHLKTCRDHLALYQPFVAEPVQTVKQHVPVIAWGPDRRESAVVLVEMTATREKHDDDRTLTAEEDTGLMPPGAVKRKESEDGGM